MQSPSLETSVQEIGNRLLNSLEDDAGSLFRKDTWYRKVMDWSMQNEHFKVQMFRFVDVLPNLSDSSDVAKHLREYFAQSQEELPSIFNFGLGLSSLAPGLLAGAVRKNVTQMAKMFITGEDPESALPVLKAARKNNVTFTIDLLGEATLSESEALDYQRRYQELIQWLAKDATQWPLQPQIDTDERGEIPRVNVSVKVTALYSQIDEAAWNESQKVVHERLREIFRTAIRHNVFINLDMEQYAHKDFLLDAFSELMLEAEFKSYPHFGIVIQAYLRDAETDIDRLTQLAKTRGVSFTVRLVKGAYWDFETVYARQKGWPIPVYLNKKESDASFERCAHRLIDAYPTIRLAIGSHNVRSIAAAIAYAKLKGLDPRAVEFQMLFGMADAIKKVLVREGYRVREYATVGDLIPGMAYLVRRLLENTSNESFLRSKYSENLSPEVLLKNPSADLVTSSNNPYAESANGKFHNEAPLDFAIEENRERMEQAIATWRDSLGQTYFPVINGRLTQTKRALDRENPSKISEVVGRIGLSTIEDADEALKTAKNYFPKWREVSSRMRADLLDKLADTMSKNKFHLAALQTLEVGKGWHEADGDVAEAIDFCRYYACQMRELDPPKRVGSAPGEVSLYHYQPRGVALVIAPWNFPLAILTGMVSAALVTGNTVIMKPAEQSSIIASELMRLMMEVGFPAGAVQFLPGLGEEVGDYLVRHKDIAMISFTGSKVVGFKILEHSAKVLPGQKHIKKVLAELGGKNAIIIDSDADLDEAVAGVTYSAFGFQGQKCSACSRVIVLDSIYDRFVSRLVEATRSLPLGPADRPRSRIGPVVDNEAYERILNTIETSKLKFQLAFQGEAPVGGYFIAPTIFQDVDPQSDLAQNEIFGPVLAIIKARDLSHALEIANGTEYALTGGIYSRSPASIERAKQEFEVGNLYINRGNTGALVERHPFGGFKLSGVGSKTGGPDYLLQYLEPRVTTENTMRRGFIPSEVDFT